MSTITPPETDLNELYPNGNVPHVPSPTDGTLPHGEGCYDCDIEDKDIPLTKRNKRDTASQKVGKTLAITDLQLADFKTFTSF